MLREKRFVFVMLLFISVGFMTSCDTVTDVIGDINLFTDSDEVQLGADVVTEIRSNPAEYPIYTKNPAVKSYLKSRIFNEILSSSKIAKKNVFNYTLEIIDDDDVLNAFALPGGPCYVYTGLLKYLDSEAALAGVLGHEIAHAEESHAAERMTEHYGVSIVIGMVLGENPSELAQIAANLFTGIAFLANSRSDEDQSDERSFEYLQDTRYYPGGVKFFFEKLRDDGLISSGGGIEKFLSTHPDPVERISSTDARLQNAGLTVYTYANADESAGIFRDEYKTNILDAL
ncbi:MAG: peptidase M48 [Melioribacteraceae bacterium]|nr:MAG: peptidase M48 [Melioribacteraceae bacterium]